MPGDDDGRRSLDPRGRIPGYGVFLTTTVLLGVSVAALTYVQTMGNLFPWDGVLRLRSPSPPDLLAGFQPTRLDGAVAHLLVTPANERCAARWSFDLAGETDRWAALAARAGFRVERSTAAPAPDAPTPGQVWILPWSLCLEADDQARLSAWLRRGGGAVVGGPVDRARARESDGPLQGWVGARRVMELGDTSSRYLMAAHRTPASARLEPGERLEIQAGRGAWAVDASHPALYWGRWELRAFPAAGGGRLAAMAVSRVGRGRMVWLGVPLGWAEPGTGQGLHVAALLSLQWSAGRTLVALSPWPRGRRHAVLLAVDVFGEPEQVAGAARYLEARGLPATYFWYSGMLEGRTELRRLVGPRAELATRGDRPVPLAGHPRTEQQRRLAASRRALERADARRPVRGVHPPDEVIDELTLHAAAQAGLDYVLGDPDYDRAYPRLARIGRRRLVVLSRAGAGDDFEHVVRDGVTHPGSVAARFLGDLRRIQDLGGLYVLNLRPDLLGSESLRPALDRVLSTAERSQAWVATAAEVAGWVRRRNDVSVRLDGDGGIEVVNEGSETIEALELELFAGGPTPQRVSLPRLAAGDRRTVAAGGELAAAR